MLNHADKIVSDFNNTDLEILQEWEYTLFCYTLCFKLLHKKEYTGILHQSHAAQKHNATKLTLWMGYIQMKWMT